MLPCGCLPSQEAFKVYALQCCQGQIRGLPGGINCTCPHTGTSSPNKFRVSLSCAGVLVCKKGEKHQLIRNERQTRRSIKVKHKLKSWLSKVTKTSCLFISSHWASTHTRQTPQPSAFTRVMLQKARVHTSSIAIIQPDNHDGHFHEKGECEESEHGSFSICCTMWLPHRGGRRSRVRRRERAGRSWKKPVFAPLKVFDKLQCSFLSSRTPQTHMVQQQQQVIKRWERKFMTNKTK